MLCFVMLCLLGIYYFSPFSLVDPETDATPEFDYTPDNQPFQQSFQASPPLIIPILPIPFSHTCIRFCYYN